MNNKDTFDILHGEFDDCPELPDSLSKRNIVAKLKTVPQEKKSTVRLQGESRLNMAASTRLDLRGMTVDEGLLEVDRYIDHALRMGIGEFTVIHGKGTGVLRSAVREYLKKSSFVKSHRLGTLGEGEDGVTIAEIKS